MTWKSWDESSYWDVTHRLHSQQAKSCKSFNNWHWLVASSSGLATSTYPVSPRALGKVLSCLVHADRNKHECIGKLWPCVSNMPTDANTVCLAFVRLESLKVVDQIAKVAFSQILTWRCNVRMKAVSVSQLRYLGLLGPFVQDGLGLGSPSAHVTFCL